MDVTPTHIFVLQERSSSSTPWDVRTKAFPSMPPAFCALSVLKIPFQGAITCSTGQDLL